MLTTSPTDAPAADVDTSCKGVAELERTQQHEDVEGFLALLAPTAVWVTGGGVRLIGLDAIAAGVAAVAMASLLVAGARYLAVSTVASAWSWQPVAKGRSITVTSRLSRTVCRAS